MSSIYDTTNLVENLININVNPLGRINIGSNTLDHSLNIGTGGVRTITIGNFTSNIIIPTDVNITGDMIITDGSIYVDGSIVSPFDPISIFEITNTTQSTSTDSGSIITAGGLGVSKNVYIGGDLEITNTTQSTSTDSGSIITAGGLGVAKDVYIGGDLEITNTTQSAAINTGAIVTAGGLGVAKNVYIGGDLEITNTTQSAAINTGAIVTAGGLGVAKDVYIGGDLAIATSKSYKINTTSLGSYSNIIFAVGNLGATGGAISTTEPLYARYSYIQQNTIFIIFNITLTTGSDYAGTDLLTITTTTLPNFYDVDDDDDEQIYVPIQIYASGVYQSSWLEISQSVATLTFTFRGTFAISTTYTCSGQLNYQLATAL